MSRAAEAVSVAGIGFMFLGLLSDRPRSAAGSAHGPFGRLFAAFCFGIKSINPRLPNPPADWVEPESKKGSRVIAEFYGPCSFLPAPDSLRRSLGGRTCRTWQTDAVE